MRKYETIYILEADLDDDARKAVIERFKGIIENHGGTVDEIDEWGKRRLAYPINKKMEGYYVLMNITCTPDAAKDLERVFKITNGLMRYIVVQKEK